MGSDTVSRLYNAIRDVPDFPKAGIVFKDITPLLLDAELFGSAVDMICDEHRDRRVEKVVAIESRGFLLGAPVALRLGVGLALARKEGKLPWRRHRVEYELEYGSDVIELHEDGIRPGERVLVVDDVLATGGTAAATLEVVKLAGGEVAGLSFLIELAFLGGRKKLGANSIQALLSYS